MPLLGANHQSMLSNLDLVGFNRNQLRQYGDFDLQAAQFVSPKGRKSRIMNCGAHGAMNDHGAQRLAAFDDTDATAKLSINVDGHEHAAS